MKKLYIIFCVLLISSNYIYAFTWDDCIEKYEKAKQFSQNIKLSYLYLKSTKSCLIKFKNLLIQTPDPEFTVKAMNSNIQMLNKNINNLIPRYIHPKNHLEQVPTFSDDYNYFKKFKNCNAIHANNKIYTAKHCNIQDAENIRYDLSYIKTDNTSKLKTAKLNLNKKGVFKYYSMSKEGLFYKVLLKEENCKFYEAQNTPTGVNSTLDLTDLTKKIEIRSNCLAIPSNSGGGVFQDDKLVAIISKTVFNKNRFLYSVVEPILP